MLIFVWNDVFLYVASMKIEVSGVFVVLIPESRACLRWKELHILVLPFAALGSLFWRELKLIPYSCSHSGIGSVRVKSSSRREKIILRVNLHVICVELFISTVVKFLSANRP